jgi:DNA polymerase-1
VKPPLLVVDGDSFAHRAYHGLPKSINRNAVVGFTNMMMRLWDAEQPRAVLVGWDSLETPTYRHEAFPAYQSGRDFDASLLEQLAMLPEVCAALGFVVAKAPGYEADDFLAAAVRAEEERGGTAVVASGDRDTYQLASDSTTILFPTKGVSEMTRIGPAEVRERYGVDPVQVPDFIALRGDPSDKIPGAKGVGPKGAAELLGKYATLEDALAEGRFAAEADALRLYRRIAAMDPSAPVPDVPDATPDWAAGSELVRGWGLNQLADRLKGHA